LGYPEGWPHEPGVLRMNLPQPDERAGWLAWARAVVVAMLEVQTRPVVEILGDFADDTAAAAGGVRIGGFYRTGSTLKVRVA
jgi:hypothetical protein